MNRRSHSIPGPPLRDALLCGLVALLASLLIIPAAVASPRIAFAKYEPSGTSSHILTIAPDGSGLKRLTLQVEGGKVLSAKVDMGRPVFEPALVPVVDDTAGKDFLRRTVVVEGRAFEISCVSMGNPHAITFVDDGSAFPVERWGPLLENHALFPNRCNVEFVQPVDAARVKARVWERGSGETQACGTGACAIGVLCATLDRTGRHVSVELPGGTLGIDWEPDGKVYLTGPVEHVFDGTLDL